MKKALVFVAVALAGVALGYWMSNKISSSFAGKWLKPLA